MKTKKKTPDEKGYNGWKNYETWNVVLWISNDMGLYSFVRSCKFRSYDKFVEAMREEGITETPDRVAYNDSGLDFPRLDEFIRETVNE